MNLITIGSGSSGNCYLLESNGQFLILDAGIPVKEIKKTLGWNITGIQGAVCTHHHNDHSRYIHDIEMMGVRILAPHEHDSDTCGSSFGDFFVEGIALKSKNGEWMHTNADGTECPIYCFLIRADGKNILYATDYRALPYRLTQFNLNTIITSCNYIKDDEMDDISYSHQIHKLYGHTSLNTAKEMIKVNKTEHLKNVALCHLSSRSDRDMILQEIQEVVGKDVTVNIAEPGTIIELT